MDSINFMVFDEVVFDEVVFDEVVFVEVIFDKVSNPHICCRLKKDGGLS
jgi:hypothetical protein